MDGSYRGGGVGTKETKKKLEKTKNQLAMRHGTESDSRRKQVLHIMEWQNMTRGVGGRGY